MAGKRAIRKGKRVEYAARDLLRELGDCERVPCSGNARALKGDLILKISETLTFKIEVKARKDFKQLYSWLDKADFLILKADYKPPLVVMPLENFKNFVKILSDATKKD